jgi:CDP-diacylglycerol--glycerol-3-phosphate 3-phosphatidyltransferase
MNLANQLTLLRIVLIPLLVVIYYLPYSWTYPASALLFTVAAITDWCDGYIARKYDQATPFGAFLDPVADKLMVAVALVLLVGDYGHPSIAVPAAVIVGREIVISALREWMAELGKRASVAVSFIGKVKTTAQMLAIIILLGCDPVSELPLIVYIRWLGIATLYVAAVLTLWSMIMYLRAAWPVLMPRQPEE